MNRKVVFAATLTVFLIYTLGISVQSVGAESKTWTVDDDGPADFHTIQEAINNSSSGDAIFVNPGIYREHVIVNKTLSLTGENGDAFVDGGGTGIVVYVEANEVNVSGFTIENGTEGIVNWAGYAVILNNTIRNCEHGVYFERTAYSPKIINNLITSNNYGVHLPVDAFGASFCNNEVIGNDYGIIIDPPFETYAHDTNVSGNIVTNNRIGIELWSSDSGVIVGNYVANNTDYGIDINYCLNNEICHNTFANNGVQAHLWTQNSWNRWDNGYPSGGNYWNDSNGTDSNHDGIGDIPYFLDANNTDNYPLKGVFSDFTATSELHVQTICNSSISAFQFNGNAIGFNVTGAKASTGFCRICVPKALMNGTYKVYVNGTEIPYTLLPFSNSICSYLYFDYTHSTEHVTIVPEFPSFLILALFMTTTLLAVTLPRRKRSSGEQFVS